MENGTKEKPTASSIISRNFKILQNTCCRSCDHNTAKTRTQQQDNGGREQCGLAQDQLPGLCPFKNGHTVFKTGRIETIDIKTHVAALWFNLGECGGAITLFDRCRPEKSAVKASTCALRREQKIQEETGT